MWGACLVAGLLVLAIVMDIYYEYCLAFIKKQKSDEPMDNEQDYIVTKDGEKIPYDEDTQE